MLSGTIAKWLSVLLKDLRWDHKKSFTAVSMKARLYRWLLQMTVTTKNHFSLWSFPLCHGSWWRIKHIYRGKIIQFVKSSKQSEENSTRIKHLRKWWHCSVEMSNPLNRQGKYSRWTRSSLWRGICCPVKTNSWKPGKGRIMLNKEQKTKVIKAWISITCKTVTRYSH